METYKYSKSAEWFERATEVIPGGIYGHLGPAEGCFIPISAYPLYCDHADGAYFWDVDGNRFIDYMCAYGPNILGYNDPDVDAAVKAQMEKANCTTSPSTLMVELAELMVDTVEMADWAFFSKNGGDATNFAVMVSRAATGRDKILMHRGGYHGVVGWTQQNGYPGITEADTSNNLFVDFNDFEAVQRVVSQHKGEIACFISTPYHHPVFEDNVLPAEGYWQKVRQLCDKEGIVLIIDDVRCGFRLDTRGSDYHYGFQADIECFCKALANGWNISAICGKESLKDAAASVMFTGSYWLSAVPMAAALACIKKLREIDSAKICLTQGDKLLSGMRDVAKSNGFELITSGETSMPFLRTASLDGVPDNNFVLHQAFTAECTRRGAFFTNHHNNFINTSISDDDIKFTLDVVDEAYKAVKSQAKTLLGKEI